MSQTTDLLNYIHQNAEMGQGTIERICKMTSDQSLKDTLAPQLEEYRRMCIASEALLSAQKADVKGVNPMAKASASLKMNASTMADKSPSHISEMLIEGSTMGIIDITKKLSEYKDADAGVVALGKALLKQEQGNIERLKKHL